MKRIGKYLFIVVTMSLFVFMLQPALAICQSVRLINSNYIYGTG
jgi:hypothetical protein